MTNSSGFSGEETVTVYVRVRWDTGSYNYDKRAYLMIPVVVDTTGTPPNTTKANESIVALNLTLPAGFYEGRYPTVNATAPIRELGTGTGVVPPDVHVSFPE
jgi:hypothetical protein